MHRNFVKYIHSTAFILAIAALAVSCDRPGAEEIVVLGDGDGRGIINGEPVGSDVYPATGQLLFQGTISALGSTMDMAGGICTATLIASDVLLTAAHCVDEGALTMGLGTVENLKFYVTFGEDQTWMSDEQYQGNPPMPDDAVLASGFVQHPDFDLQSMGGDLSGLANFNDIALVFLEAPITERPFSYLPLGDETNQVVDDMAVDIIGYGQRSIGSGDPFDTPTDVNERYWAHTFINELGDWEMQIGSDATTGRKCHGDSGGPTFALLDVPTAVKERVIGVTSRAYDSVHDCEIGGVDTRVEPHLDWIEEEMIAACEDGLRTDCDDPGIPEPELEGDTDTGADTDSDTDSDTDTDTDVDGDSDTDADGDTDTDADDTDDSDNDEKCSCSAVGITRGTSVLGGIVEALSPQ